MRKILSFFLIFTISTLTILPATGYSQTKINQNNLQSKQDNLKITFEKEKLNRINALLNNSIENATPIDPNAKLLKSEPLPRSGGISKKVWIPILIGVGVGVFLLLKYYNPSPSGIRCVDGTISNAENRQGACSHHGGIAPGN